mgnify:CR=1 FL=1
MVNIVLVFFGTLFVAFGWVFYRDPQAGFRIANFPFAPHDDGLTEAGETPYRVRGLILIAAGLLFIIASIFA